MLPLNRKEDCCGCSACQQICPKRTIEMIYDEEGFLYPHIDNKKCVECGLCDKVCPVLHAGDNQTGPLRLAYAARTTDDIALANSTSGGLSYEIARHVIRNNGVVFGACYGKNNVVEHQKIDTEIRLSKMQGSKYVQSNIINSYFEVKELLKKGTKVLFTGTPCQIEGLISFLGQEYSNLLTQDIICHGTPSPMLWNKYLGETRYTDANNIVFRGKNEGKGWALDPRFLVVSSSRTCDESFYKNHFSFFFSQNYSLRPICFECPFKTGYKKSDITCADLWGIDEILPDYNHDDKGMSLAIANTQKGQALLDQLYHDGRIIRQSVSYDLAIKNNMMALRSVKKPEQRKEFFDDISRMTFKQAYKKYKPKESMVLCIKKKLYNIKTKIIKN